MEPLLGQIKHYDWGSTDAIAELLGIRPDGRPMAEYWLGAHPGGPATLGSRRLDEVIGDNPDLLGDSAILEFDCRLPFMMKVLSAAKPLSLQAHPNRVAAQEGFAREEAADIPVDAAERTFKDPWDKPEVLVALTPFEALAGFRVPEETVELFSAIGLSRQAAEIIAPLRHRHGAAGLAEVFLDCLVLDEQRRGAVTDVVTAAVNHVADPGPVGEFACTAVELDEYFPGDPSLLAALLMNRRTLQPGEALHIRPGTMHAYLRGTGLEVLGSSDNVLRGGLTHKHIDPAALVQVFDFTPGPSPLLVPEPEAPGLWHYNCGERAFAVWRVDARPGRLIDAPAETSGRILLTTEGEIGVSTGSDALVLPRGSATFIKAGAEVGISGDGVAFLAATGIDA